MERDFVLEPMCEIAPGFIHPVFNMKICDFNRTDLTANILRKYQLAIIIQ